MLLNTVDTQPSNLLCSVAKVVDNPGWRLLIYSVLSASMRCLFCFLKRDMDLCHIKMTASATCTASVLSVLITSNHHLQIVVHFVRFQSIFIQMPLCSMESQEQLLRDFNKYTVAECLHTLR